MHPLLPMISSGSAAEAAQSALRFGAPSSAVDPLVALLFSLRRMQTDVLDTLAQLGVAAECLPFPFGSGAPCAAAESAGCNASSSGSSGGSDTDVIDAYTAAAGEAQPGDPRARRAVVRSVLGLAGGGSGAEAAAALELLVAEGDGVRWTAEDEGPPAARRRTEGQLAFAVSGAELQTMVDGAWRRCEERARAAAHEMHGLLKSLCSRTIAGSLSCHAKYIELSREEVGRTDVLPSCEALKANYEEMILINDTLSRTQLRVSEGLRALDPLVEEFCSVAVTVADRERQYWKNVQLLEKEYHATRHIQRTIHHIRRGASEALTSSTLD